MPADAAIAVAFVSSHEQFGGAESLLESLLDRLDRAWVRAILFLRPGPFADALRARGYPVRVVAPDADSGRLRGLLALRRELHASGARVVHANGAMAAVWVALATLGTSTRIVWLKVDCARDGWLARLVARRCAAVIGISATVTETFRGRLRGRVHVVHPGIRRPEVDREHARGFVRRLLSLPPDARVVVLSGRLSPEKGQLELLEAASQLVARRPELRIALLGGEIRDNPGYGDRLRRRARELGIADSTAFVGHRGPGIGAVDDAIRFVGGCDVLVAPSRSEPASGWREGFGLAAVEALWAGTPVVAYRHGALPEVLGECAYFVPEGDRDALAGGIASVLDDEALARRQVACGRALLDRAYRWEDAIPAIERVYAVAARR